MSQRHHRAGISATLAVLVALAIPQLIAAQTVDDYFLLSTSVAPNVILLFDNSYNMNQIEWHPAYNPQLTPSCANWSNTTTYSSASLPSSAKVCAANKSRTIYAPSNPTLWNGRYLNWYFSLGDNDPILAQIQNSVVTPASCNQAGSQTRFFQQYRRTRGDAARQVFLDTICVAKPRGVRFGMAEFRVPADATGLDPTGGFVSIPPDAPSSNGAKLQAHLANLSILAGTATPLAETMFQIYTFLMPRTVANIPLGNDGLTQFPAYVYDEFGANNPSKALGDVVQYACQKNFVIMVTTGVPTYDDFTSDPASTSVGFSNFRNLIGDYYESNASPLGNPDLDDLRTVDKRTFWLDDVVKYMHDKDLRPDYPDVQTVDTYAIGFGTTPADESYLRYVAVNGNGLFYHAQDGTTLAAALNAALNDIQEKARSFTAATVPSARTADGGDLYNSFFLPSGDTAFWEGHLRAWLLSANGQILDSNGNCALVDPTGKCKAGPFAPMCQSGQSSGCVVPYWDAGNNMPAQSARSLYVSKLNTATPPVPVRTNLDINLTAADMKTTGYTVPPSTAPWNSYPTAGSQALNAQGLADEVVMYARGCTFGTGVQTSDSAPAPNGNQPCEQRPWLLGDIFHSDPIVVRNPPDRPQLGAAYTSFRTSYLSRDRVIYTGTNGGFLEGIHAGTWNSSTMNFDHGTGVEKFGFMPWEPRTNIKNQPIDNPATRTHYVDGAPQAADAWFYPSATTGSESPSDWRTVLVGGLREGGHHYYALDVTNPSNLTGPAGNLTYPNIQWEFPNENDFNSGTGDFVNMGQTWGAPVITKIKLEVNSNNNSGKGFERWVAIVTGGYDATSDPNPTAVDPVAGVYSPTSTKGRAIYVIDLETGKVIAQQAMGNPTKCKTPPDVTAPNDCMDYSVVSTPAVLDLDGDGYADVIYVGDLSGQVWKWWIHPVGDDRVNDGTGLRTQPNWRFYMFFQAPTATIPPTGKSAVTYYKNIFQPPAAAFVKSNLYLAFGTGERHAIGFLGVTDNGSYNPSTTPPDPTWTENNRFYVIHDPNPFETESTLPEPILESNLTNISCPATNPSCQPPSMISNSGFWFRVADGEKFVTTPVIFAQKVITASFTPSNLQPGQPGFDPCTQRGTGNLYAFDMLTGIGDFTDPSGNAVRYLNTGTGLPTDPKISVGVNGKNNEIVIQKSGTDVQIIGTHDVSFERGIIYWRALH